jgi:hypothetical protein
MKKSKIRGIYKWIIIIWDRNRNERGAVSRGVAVFQPQVL